MWIRLASFDDVCISFPFTVSVGLHPLNVSLLVVIPKTTENLSLLFFRSTVSTHLKTPFFGCTLRYGS